MRINHLIYLLLIVCSFHSCSEDNKAITITDETQLDSILNHFVDENYYPFIYARLEDLDGKVIYEHSSVNEDLLPNTEINGDTWFRIWSMSKIVTISVVLDLIEDGIINIYDPVSKIYT